MFIKPIKKLVAANDKLTKTIFSLGKNYSKFFGEVQTKKPFTLKEGKQSETNTETGKKETKAVETKFRLELDAANLDEETAKRYRTEPLDAFDRAVFTAVCTQYAAGVRCSTIGTIHRLITGKAAGRHFVPHENQAAAIRESVDKMSRLELVDFNSDVFKKFNYNGGKMPRLHSQKILPCRWTRIPISAGVSIEGIELLAESPLSTISKAKKFQQISFEAELLNGDRRHSSRRIVGAAFYTACRITEIIEHSKEMKPVITVEDVLEKCNLDARADSRKERREQEAVKETIGRLIDRFKGLGTVEACQLVDEGKYMLNFKESATED